MCVLHAGVGGVSSAEDAYAKIRSGASLVQLYSALVYEGACCGREAVPGARGLPAPQFDPRYRRRRDETEPKLPFLSLDRCRAHSGARDQEWSRRAAEARWFHLCESGCRR